MLPFLQSLQHRQQSFWHVTNFANGFLLTAAEEPVYDLKGLLLRLCQLAPKATFKHNFNSFAFCIYSCSKRTGVARYHIDICL